MKQCKLTILAASILTLSACSDNIKPQGNKPVLFQCNSGTQIAATYTGDYSQARINYKNKEHVLNEHMSASGSQYQSESLIWWEKGEEATLFDKKTDKVLEECKQ